MRGMIIGYARVSTDGQNLEAQTDALKAVAAERIFADKISGGARKRPELDKLFAQLCEGDVVVVTKYDRLARSLRDLLDIVAAIEARGAGFRSLAEDIDTTTSAGRLVFQVFALIAQFERERNAERTKEGLEAARRRGRVGGAVRRPESGGPPDAGRGGQAHRRHHLALRRERFDRSARLTPTLRAAARLSRRSGS